MTRSRLLIVGAGGHGRSVAEAVLAAGDYDLAGFVDDAAPGLTSVWGFAVLGTTADVGRYRVHADHAIVAVGNNAVRESLCNRLLEAGFELPTIVHPRAIVSPRAVIGHGCTIMAGAVVGTEARLGCGVIVNCGAVVDHDAQVHDYAHLAVNACMAGDSELGRSAWMQAGAALGYGVKVAAGVVLRPGTALSG
jgi:sugar O-acyltransferase (sialic acid O-acetyltransferase NeuD family)